MANTEVGTAYVAIIPSAKGFARNLQKEIAKEFAGSNLDKAIGDALGERKPIKLPVQADLDTAKLPDTVPVRAGREPKLPVELDPLIAQFQSDVRRQVGALARTVNAEIPVRPETAGLRSALAAQISQIERELKADIPTEPAGRREYEAKLQALVAQVSHRVKASVRVEPEVDRRGFAGLSGLGSLPKSLINGFKELSSAASDVQANVTKMGGSLVGAVVTATGPVGALVGALIAAAAANFTLVAATIAAVPALYLLGGALGSLPALAGGAGAAIGALALGFMGIADHFKETAKAGGGAGENLAARARQVAQATRGVESAQRSLARAQREVVLAQQAVTRARQEEVERLQDLNRSAKRASLDEERAILRVKEAKEALDDARATGRVDDIKQAGLEYREAVLGVDEAKDAVEDLKVEQAKAAKVGVEGSDQVQDALRRQRDATEGVIAANEQLLSAQEALQAANEKPPSGGGAVQQLTKLAPAAQKFVDTIKSLKPAFEQLRLGVQQKLFAGLDKSVERLATAWFPQLNKTLGDYATTFNGLAKRAATSLSQKSFIDNMAEGAEATRGALERIGRAVAGPLVDAFGRLSRAASPFIKRLGDEVGKLLEDFSKWIEKLDKNGSLDEFFVRAGEILTDVFDMGRDIASIFGSVMSILFGEEETTTSPWEGLKSTLDDIATWFKDPENQQKVRDFFDKVQKFMREDLPNAVLKAKEAIDKVEGWIDTIDRWTTRITEFRDRVRDAFTSVGIALRTVGGPIGFVLGQFGRLPAGAVGAVSLLLITMRGAPDRIRAALGDTGRLLYQAGWNIIQGLIDGIRSRFGGSTGLGAAAAAAAGLISDYFPHSPAKRGPLSGSGSPYHSGRSIVGMLSSGITDTLGTAQSAASDLAGTFALDGGPAAGIGVSSSAVPAPAPVMLGFGGDAPDSFMRWMKENVRIYYGGDPNAALGS